MAARLAHHRAISGIAALLLLAACKDENRYVAPPPPKVSVAMPAKRDVTLYLELNGTSEATNSVDLVARVQGVLQEIGYTDGTFVPKGTNLFTIEPQPYYQKLQQAQAQQSASQAAAIYADKQYQRQSSLGRNDYASQSNVDQALSQRDETAADLLDKTAATQLAAINYSYTHVAAPFDGLVTRHLYSIGQLVGATTPTRLATILQLDPIYASFNISELDVLRIRAAMAERGQTQVDLSRVPVAVGLANETGYPHAGVLNYIEPQVDTSTGTMYVRALLPNPNHVMLPGNFLRVRIPIERKPDALLVPDTAIGSDQGGRYVLVVDDQNVVAQKHVQPGQLDGDLRVIDSGLAATDRVIVDGMQRAIPGNKVEPQVRTASATR